MQLISALLATSLLFAVQVSAKFELKVCLQNTVEPCFRAKADPQCCLKLQSHCQQAANGLQAAPEPFVNEEVTCKISKPPQVAMNATQYLQCHKVAVQPCFDLLGGVACCRDLAEKCKAAASGLGDMPNAFVSLAESCADANSTTSSLPTPLPTEPSQGAPDEDETTPTTTSKPTSETTVPSNTPDDSEKKPVFNPKLNKQCQTLVSLPCWKSSRAGDAPCCRKLSKQCHAFAIGETEMPAAFVNMTVSCAQFANDTETPTTPPPSTGGDQNETPVDVKPIGQFPFLPWYPKQPIKTSSVPSTTAEQTPTATALPLPDADQPDLPTNATETLTSATTTSSTYTPSTSELPQPTLPPTRFIGKPISASFSAYSKGIELTTCEVSAGSVRGLPAASISMNYYGHKKRHSTRGRACGQCWQLTIVTAARGGIFSNEPIEPTVLKVAINDECSVDDWCFQSDKHSVNKENALAHFELQEESFDGPLNPMLTLIESYGGYAQGFAQQVEC